MKHLTHRIALIFAIMGLSCVSAFAQQVKGTVKDAFGEPVIGAAVIVDGTSIGTTVDLDGSFILNQAVPSDAVLVVSSIGYKTARVPVGGSLDIILEEDTTMLEETVVVGYGVQKKSVVTAAISSITSEDLKSQSQTRVDNLLQGPAILQKFPVLLCQTDGGVHHVENQICLRRQILGALDAVALHLVVAFPQTGSVKEAGGNAAKGHPALNPVPGGSVDVGDDGAVLLQKGVEEAGLSRIGPPAEHHPHPVLIQPLA